jgi:hypothetical protein
MGNTVLGMELLGDVLNGRAREFRVENDGGGGGVSKGR